MAVGTAVKRPAGRSLKDFEPLSPAETKVLAACAEGTFARIGTEVPAVKTEDNVVRGAFIRFMLLGGDSAAPLHERGVRITGAYVTGVLDLTGCHIRSPVALRKCLIEKKILALDSSFKLLAFAGCKIHGMNADRLVCTGSIFLRNGFETTGEVRFSNARIDGTLSCHNARFLNPRGEALRLKGAVIGKSVLLSDGFHADGMVNLVGTEIRGTLDCQDGEFVNPSDVLIDLMNAKIQDQFIWRKIRRVEGRMNLASAYAATFVDDAESWAGIEEVTLDGFRFDRLAGPCRVAARLAPLLKQSSDEFWPQPWEQLARTLRDMGHSEAARRVGIEREWRRLRAGAVGQREVAGKSWPRRRYHGLLNAFSRVWHVLYGFLAGFGYRPLWTVGWMIGVWLACAGLYHLGDMNGVFGPSSAIIQTSSATAGCGAPGDRQPFPIHIVSGAQTTDMMTFIPTENWTSCKAMPAAYTTFHPLIYSLDLLLPVVDLQQQDAWSPMVSNRAQNPLAWGIALRWLLWFEIMFGWASSVLLVAVLGKLVERD